MFKTEIDTHRQTVSARAVDVQVLTSELQENITGEDRFDHGSRAQYSTDGSNHRQLPIGVVIPKTEGDIVETIRVCRKHKAPLLSRGGGTSLAGQCCNVAVVMDLSKYYNQILEVDQDKKLARVQTGIVLDDLRKETRKSGLSFGPDPATHTVPLAVCWEIIPAAFTP